jgi:hypothetical protein
MNGYKESPVIDFTLLSCSCDLFGVVQYGSLALGTGGCGCVHHISTSPQQATYVPDEQQYNHHGELA